MTYLSKITELPCFLKGQAQAEHWSWAPGSARFFFLGALLQDLLPVGSLIHLPPPSTPGKETQALSVPYGCAISYPLRLEEEWEVRPLRWAELSACQGLGTSAKAP